jgi:hypothetical protein
LASALQLGVNAHFTNSSIHDRVLRAFRINVPSPRRRWPLG